jgi:hypothetical protein
MNNHSPTDITQSRTHRDGLSFNDNKKSGTDLNFPIGNEEGIILGLYGTALYGAGYRMLGGIMAGTGVAGFIYNYI